MANVGAILLAAGLSQRMGRPKALLPWRGIPLIYYQIRTLRRAGLKPVLVVLGHRADELGPRVDYELGATALLNPFYRKGKTTSLKTGLRALDPNTTDSAVILNVDQPRTLQTLSTIIEHHNQHSALISIPTHKGKRGHPIVVSLKLMDDLMAVSEAQQGLKAVMRTYAEDIGLVEVDSDEVLLDLNTPEDYEAAFRKFGSP